MIDRNHEPAGRAAQSTFARKRPQEPIWKPGGKRSLSVSEAPAVPGTGGGRFFDEFGRALTSLGGGAEAEFALSGSRVLRVSTPISDREKSERPYEENVWVRAAIKAIKSGFSRLKLRLYDRDPSDKEAVEIETHPLLDLLDRPNVLMTSAQFFEAHAVGMKLDGEVIWFLADVAGLPVKTDTIGNLTETPAQVIPVRGGLVEVEYNANGIPQKYRYTSPYSSQTAAASVFPAASVVHFRDFDPYDLTRGLGDGQCLERETDLYFQAFRAMDGMVRSGGDPGGFIIFEHSVDPSELQRRQDEADEQFAGPNARRIKLLDAKAKFYPNSVRPSDMQYRELVEWLRDSILTGFGVSPPVVGVYDSATYNNVETANREMWTGPNGILTLAGNTSDVITNMLLPRMARIGSKPAAQPGAKKIHAAFDHTMIEALQEDTGDKITRAADVAAKGIGVSFNEVLEIQGVEVEMPEEGDRKWVASGLNDLEDPEAGKPEPPPALAGPGADGKPGKGKKPKPGKKNGNGGELSRDTGGAVFGGGREAGEQARPAVAFSLADEPQIAREKEFAGRVEKWLSAFERAQLRHLRAVAAGRVPQESGAEQTFGIADQIVNPHNLTEQQWDYLLLSAFAWSNRLDRDVRVALRASVIAALAEAHGEVGGPLLTVTHPEVVEMLAQRRMKLAEGVTSTTVRRVRNAIARVMTKQVASGSLRSVVKAALPELTEELRRVFGTKEARAATVAQTEVGGAENSARVKQYGRSGVRTVSWVASIDEATRASHLATHGQIITLGGRFTNGLRYPHDPEAPASEVVNCRCKVRAESYEDPFAEGEQQQ